MVRRDVHSRVNIAHGGQGPVKNFGGTHGEDTRMILSRWWLHTTEEERVTLKPGRAQRAGM